MVLSQAGRAVLCPPPRVIKCSHCQPIPDGAHPSSVAELRRVDGVSRPTRVSILKGVSHLHEQLADHQYSACQPRWLVPRNGAGAASWSSRSCPAGAGACSRIMTRAETAPLAHRSSLASRFVVFSGLTERGRFVRMSYSLRAGASDVGW